MEICNLYRLTTPIDAVAALFGARVNGVPNVGSEVCKKDPGLVVTDGVLRSMTWGFPRPAFSKETGEPVKPTAVNNAREDRLGTRFWRKSFAERRCLVPLNAWAEAEGRRGHMTRTWYSPPHENVFAIAGIWRPSDEWGDVYSMVTVPSCPAIVDVNDRMPVILATGDWHQWVCGSPYEAFALCRTWDEGLRVQRTDEPWSASRAPRPLQLPLF